MQPTPDDVAAFRRDGFWVSRIPVVTGAKLARLRDHAMRVVGGGYETGRPPMSRNPADAEQLAGLVQINNAYWADATLGRMVTDVRIGAAAAALAGVAGIRLWHDQLLYKPGSGAHAASPGPGANGADADGEITFHQDLGYWQCISDPRALTCRLALLDEHPANGCMQVVRGSHRLTDRAGTPFIAGRNVFFPPNPPLAEQLSQLAAAAGLDGPPPLTPLAVSAGCATFHTAKLVHGSLANTDAAPAGRLSLVVHMIVDGTVFKGPTGPGAGHSSNTLLQPAAGEPYAGYYFPLIFREGEGNVWSTPRL